MTRTATTTKGPTAPHKETVVALDLGTSSVRAMLFDSRAHPVPGAASQRPYKQTITPDGGVETDPDALVDLTLAALGDLLKGLEPAALASIKGIGASCFWHSLVGVDAGGHAVTPLYSWADTRAADAALALRGDIDPSEYHVRTGCELHPCFWPAKLRWLQSALPAQFRKVARWLGFADYLALRLFDRPVASVSMASGTGLFDPNRCDWDERLLEMWGLSRDNLPIVDTAETPPPSLGAGDGHGGAAPHALKALAGIPWFPAWGDGACSNIGGGGVDGSALALNIGTSAAIRITVEAERADIVPGLFCYRIDRRRLLCGGAFATGGNAYAWLGGALNLGDEHRAAAEIAKRPPAAHGLTVMPFWAGERSPGWNVRARAAIHGMNLHTTPVDILQASLEGAAYLYDIVRRRLMQRYPDAQTIVATGGALTHDRVWTQILADVFGVPVETRPVFEASSRGAAILALESLGIVHAPADLPLGRRKLFTPDPERHKAHADAAARFEEIYRASFQE